MPHQKCTVRCPPPVALTPKHAHRKHPDSSVMILRTRSSREAAASLLSTPPPRLFFPPYHSLWPPCPLKDVHTRGQGATLDLSVFRPLLSPRRFEEPCEGGGLYGRSCILHEAVILSSTCTPTHVACTGAAVPSLISSRRGRIPHPPSCSDIGSQNSTLT